jgi:hypothetical protein
MNFLSSSLTTIFWSENKLALSSLVNNVFLTPVLISISMSSDNNWLGPPWNQSWDVRNNDWLSEHGSIKNVSNSTVRTFPHLFEVKFSNTVLIWSDSSALDTDFAFLDSIGSVNSDLVTGCISVLDAQIEVLVVDIDVWVDVL